MSDQAEQRPNSQQKKTGISIITDPLQHKKPAIADDQIFKPPPISAMRAANASDNFLKPSFKMAQWQSVPFCVHRRIARLRNAAWTAGARELESSE